MSLPNEMSSSVDNAAARGPADWRSGRRASGARESARRRWQEPAEQTRKRRRGSKVRTRSMLFLLLGAALIGFLLYQLLHQPRRVPVVIVAGAPYGDWLPPNQYVREDIEALKRLDEFSLTVYDDSEAWESKDTGLIELQDQLETMRGEAIRNGVAMFYVNMHGAVDGDGNPCLIPPGASPESPDSWILLESFFRMICGRVGPGAESATEAILPRDVKKLVVMDCARMRVNWRTGTLYNTFADRLPDVVERFREKNLVVVNAAESGQRSWVSPERRSSALCYYLHLGLAGDADGFPSSRANGRVSLRELHAYLGRNVNSFAKRNRGEPQTPQLLPADTADFPITWSLKARKQNDLQAAAKNPLATASFDQTQIQDLWVAHDELLQRAAYSRHPVLWSEFQRNLIRLEQYVEGGQAYTSTAKTTVRRLEELRQQLDSDLPFTAKLAAHSLPLAQRWQSIERAAAGEIAQMQQQLEALSDSSTIEQTLANWPAGSASQQLVERHFLLMLRKYQTAELWNDQTSLIGQTLQLRRFAEQIAVPPDPRIHYWLRGSMVDADVARRETEDLLLAGPTADTQSSLEARIASAKNRLTDVQTLSNQVKNALHVRDRARAELPYVAMWLTRPQPPGEDAKEVDREIGERLSNAITATQRLAESIDHRPGLDASTVTNSVPFASSVSDVARRFESLRTDVTMACDNLLETDTPTAVGVREIESVLETPLVSAESRNRLRDKLATYRRRLLQETNDQQASELPSEPLVTATHYLARFNGRPHPALEILKDHGWTERHSAEPADASDSSQPKDSENRDKRAMIEQDGEQIRKWLAAIPDRVARLDSPVADNTAEITNADGATGSSRTSQQRNLAERLVRTAAPIGFRDISPNPAELIRRFDWQQVLLWHTRRTLDDFWGPASNQELSFFETAAKNYLQAVNNIHDYDAAVGRQVDTLLKLLSTRRNAAENAFRRTQATDIPLFIDANDEEEAVVKIWPYADESLGIPDGFATVMFARNGQRIGDQAFALDTRKLQDEHTFTFQIFAGDLPVGGIVQATTMFRGHQFERDAVFQMAGGVAVDFRPTQYEDASITLYGAERKKSSVMFLLDCSYSMNRPASREAPGRGVITHMDIAKSALVLLMNEMGKQRNKRVGVTFFGHRVGWNTDNPSEILPQSDYAKEIPTDLQPYDDVEIVLPMGRFDAVTISGVERLLKSVKGWGETPLFLAIDEALRALDAEPPGSDKNIVIISDGANQQLNPSPEAARTLQQILDALDRRGDVRVFVVGLGIPDNEQAVAVQQFQSLAEHTNGDYAPADDAQKLLDELQQATGLTTYQVTGEAGNRRFRDQYLGETVTIDRLSRTADWYDVSWDGASPMAVQLEGGEALELQVAADRRSIQTITYRKRSPRFVPTVNDDQTTRQISVGVHQPLIKEGSVSFPFSFQHNQRQFVARPQEVWIEVTPRKEGGLTDFPKYTFYDVNYEAGKPVPLMDWIAADWPTDAVQAEIRMFGKDASSPPTPVALRRSLREVADLLPDQATGDLAGFPIVTERSNGNRDIVAAYQVRTRRGDGQWIVTVIERHSPRSIGLRSLKVELTPRADRIKHQFDEDHHLALHTFFYDIANGPSLDDMEVLFTKRSDLEQGAWHLSQPVTVHVANDDDVVPLTPPDVLPKRDLSPPAKQNGTEGPALGPSL